MRRRCAMSPGSVARPAGVASTNRSSSRNPGATTFAVIPFSRELDRRNLRERVEERARRCRQGCPVNRTQGGGGRDEEEPPEVPRRRGARRCHALPGTPGGFRLRVASQSCLCELEERRHAMLARTGDQRVVVTDGRQLLSRAVREARRRAPSVLPHDEPAVDA